MRSQVVPSSERTVKESEHTGPLLSFFLPFHFWREIAYKVPSGVLAGQGGQGLCCNAARCTGEADPSFRRPGYPGTPKSPRRTTARHEVSTSLLFACTTFWHYYASFISFHAQGSHNEAQGSHKEAGSANSLRFLDLIGMIL